MISGRTEDVNAGAMNLGQLLPQLDKLLQRPVLSGPAGPRGNSDPGSCAFRIGQHRPVHGIDHRIRINFQIAEDIPENLQGMGAAGGGRILVGKPMRPLPGTRTGKFPGRPGQPQHQAAFGQSLQVHRQIISLLPQHVHKGGELPDRAPAGKRQHPVDILMQVNQPGIFRLRDPVHRTPKMFRQAVRHRHRMQQIAKCAELDDQDAFHVRHPVPRRPEGGASRHSGRGGGSPPGQRPRISVRRSLRRSAQSPGPPADSS